MSSEIDGRGVIWIDAWNPELLALCHKETGQRFDFAWADIDEVIGMLSTYRMMREAVESGDDDRNGKEKPDRHRQTTAGLGASTRGGNPNP